MIGTLFLIAAFPAAGLCVCFGRQIGDWLDRRLG